MMSEVASTWSFRIGDKRFEFPTSCSEAFGGMPCRRIDARIIFAQSDNPAVAEGNLKMLKLLSDNAMQGACQPAEQTVEFARCLQHEEMVVMHG